MTARETLLWGLLTMFAISCLGAFFGPILGLIWFIVWNGAAFFVWRVASSLTGPHPREPPEDQP